MMRNLKLMLLIFFASAVLLTSCNFSPEGGITPTVETLSTPTSEGTASPTASMTPSPTPTTNIPLQPEVVTPPPTDTLGPPTETSTPTETPGPYKHVVKAGETLGYIIQLYGYPYDPQVINAVVRLNFMSSADALSEGDELLIPRQTATPIPVGLEQTQAADATLGVSTVSGVRLPYETTITCYEVQEGDTIVGIADFANTTLEILSQLNRSLNWFGCNFENYSGGPDCNPTITVGQCINIPAPTPTPSLSPTPSGSETATPTPTYAPPIVAFPPEGAIVPGGVSRLRLQWVSVGVLAENEYYLVQVTDLSSGSSPYNQVTKNTYLDLPDSLAPADGQTHTFNWTVSVATPNEQGVYRPISGSPTVRSFQWQSR